VDHLTIDYFDIFENDITNKLKKILKYKIVYQNTLYLINIVPTGILSYFFPFQLPTQSIK
jgi:hypothetical protein